MKKNYVIITGASSGIGEGFAWSLAREGWSLVLTARRQERLETLAQELKTQTQVEVETISADLSKEEGTIQIFQFCQEKNLTIEGLINNAGLGFQKSFSKIPPERIDTMLQVNLVNVVKLTHLFLPSFLERQQGFILNVASTASFQPVPYFGVYAATKSFVLSFSEALHEEVKADGVRVSCLCPGPVSTEFQQVAEMDPRFFAKSQSVKEVVDAGMRLLKSGNAVGWTSLFQRLFSFGSELMPRVVKRKVAAWMMLKSGAE